MKRRKENKSEENPKKEPVSPLLKPPFIPTTHRGFKSIFESFLEDHPLAAKQHHETMLKVHGPDYQPLKENDISKMEDVYEYACFEITRTQREGVLRGKTFVDYMNLLCKIFAVRTQVENSKLLAKAYAESIKSDKKETNAFYEIICELIILKVSDLNEQKEFITELKRLYDEYEKQQQEKIQRLTIEYPTLADELELPPTDIDGGTKEEPNKP